MTYIEKRQLLLALSHASEQLQLRKKACGCTKYLDGGVGCNGCAVRDGAIAALNGILEALEEEG